VGEQDQIPVFRRIPLGHHLRFIELTENHAYTAVMNPDAERWRELAVYDLGTAEAMLAAGR
jgi:hypothetical protein